jgi:hypothetical protein
LCYWQEWANGCAVNGFSGIAEHAVDGWPVVAPEGWDSGLLSAALHNTHHLGQIITLRQLMGVWPPPSGTITW